MLTLYYLDDYPALRIASLLDISHGAVRQRLGRARRQLRKEMLHMVEKTIHAEAPGGRFNETLEKLLEQVKTSFHQGDFQAAIPSLEHAARLSPDDLMITMLMADAYECGSPKDEADIPKWRDHARLLFETILTDNPDNDFVRIRHTKLVAQSLPFEDARQVFQENLQRIEGKPIASLLLFDFGELYLNNNHFEQARDLFLRARDQAPLFAGMVSVGIGITYAIEGITERNETKTEQALETIGQGVAALEALPATAMTDWISRHISMNTVYTAYFKNVDLRLGLLCLGHFWIAAIRQLDGETDRAGRHLNAIVTCISTPESIPSRYIIDNTVKVQLKLVDGHFSFLADQPAIAELRRLTV